MNLTRIQHEIVTEDGQRFYLIGGERLKLQSVTSTLKVINKPFLNAWRVKLGKEDADAIRDETSEYGKAVHAGCKRIIDGKPYGTDEFYELPKPVQNGIKAFVQFKKTVKLEPIVAEFFVYSLIHEHAGTFDLLAYINDKLVLADYKTGGLWPETWLQLAAYADSLYELFNVWPDEIWRIQLNRETGICDFDSNVKPKDSDPFDIEEALDAYLGAHAAAEFLQARGGTYW